MRHKQRTKSALSVVSYLFLLVGLIALFGMVVNAARGFFHLSFGILGIGIFAGLRRYSRAWRICALGFTWYGIITLSIALFFCLSDRPTSATPILFSQRFAQVPADWLAVPLIMILLVTLWQYRVLTHPAILRLFNETRRPSATPPPVGAQLDGAAVK